MQLPNHSNAMKKHSWRLALFTIWLAGGFGVSPLGLQYLRAQNLPETRAQGTSAGTSADGAAATTTLDAETRKLLVRASALHDLSLAYLENGDLEKVTWAARELLDLPFPPEREYLLATSLAIIAEKLGARQQYGPAQTLLDEALEVLEQKDNHVKIYMMKARLFRTQGDNDRAIRMWERVLELDPDAGN